MQWSHCSLLAMLHHPPPRKSCVLLQESHLKAVFHSMDICMQTKIFLLWSLLNPYEIYIFFVNSLKLHYCFLQQYRGPPNVSKDALCHNHFFAILCIFSGIYLVNYVLMNSAANVFYSTGLVLLTFQDAMSLMEQVSSFSISVHIEFYPQQYFDI